MKHILSLALVCAMVFLLLPIRALAYGGTYTVTLDPGDGTGEPITYSCSYDQYDSLPTEENAGHLQFYQVKNNVVSFKLNADYCPESFTAPVNYLFDGWEGIDELFAIPPGKNLTLTAKWKIDQTRTYGPINGIPAADGGHVWLGGIRWRVIGQSAASWLLISADVMGNKMTWDAAKAYCGTVYDGFTALERAAVIPTDKTDHVYTSRSLQNSGNPYHFYAAHLSNATLFLLSAAEAEYYFWLLNDRASNGHWWLRSQDADFDDSAGFVTAGGALGSFDYSVKYNARPAFQFDPSSVLFMSAAEGGKSTAPAGSGEFRAFRTSSKQSAKLTLADNSRSGFSAAHTGNVCPGGILSVTYSDAPTGENEYVSAVICDASGAPLYYASVPSEGSGTAQMTLPGSLTIGGSYTLKVFSEQLNGDDQTDYAGGIRTFDLNVTQAFTIRFSNWDYTILQDGFAAAGQTPVYRGETPTKPSNDPRIGYVFDGWDPTLGPITDHTYYSAAFRAEAKNLVTFNANGGKGTMAVDSYFGSDGTYTLPPCDFTAPQGYVFRDWTVTREIEGGLVSSTTHMAGSILSGLTNDLTVTANWIELSMRAAPAVAGTVEYANGVFTAAANAGYTFDHWEYANDEYSAAPVGTEWPKKASWQPPEVNYKIYTAVFTANEYALTIPDSIPHGTVTKASGIPKTGSTIRLTVTPDEGYWLASLAYTPEGGTPVAITETDNSGRYFFTMPADNVTLTAIFVTHYSITDDGAAQAYAYNDSSEQIFPTEALEGTALSLWLREDAQPEPGYYFTGEFTVNGTNLGSDTIEDGLIIIPVAEFIMPAENVMLGAVQAPQESMSITLSPEKTRVLPLDAWMQLQFIEPPLIRCDETTGTEALDVNRDGLPDLRIVFDDEAYCVNLTRMTACGTFGEFAFTFSGPTDRYGTITFILPAPTFDVPDFTLPAFLTTVEEAAFEGIAASVVDVPASCAGIDDHAFRNCPNLTQIRIPAACVLGTDVFDGCTLVYVFGAAGSSAEAYCQTHTNCVFVPVE